MTLPLNHHAERQTLVTRQLAREVQVVALFRRTPLDTRPCRPFAVALAEVAAKRAKEGSFWGENAVAFGRRRAI